MKKRWKIFWTVCAISGVSGVIFLLISCLVFGVTFQKIESMMPNGISIGKFEEAESYDETGEIAFSDWNDSYEGITSLDIDLKAGEIEILTSYGDCVEIEAESINEKLEVSAYRNGSTLVINSADKLKDIAKQSLGTLTIYLPQEFILDEAKISVGAGTLYIESINVNDFSVDVGAGAANIDFFHAKEADFDCGAGEMRIYGYIEEETDIDCGLGNIRYDTPDHEENYNYKISCGVGEIICGSNQFSGIGGEKKIENHHASKEMDIDCGLGNVEVVFEGGHF